MNHPTPKQRNNNAYQVDHFLQTSTIYNHDTFNNIDDVVDIFLLLIKQQEQHNIINFSIFIKFMNHPKTKQHTLSIVSFLKTSKKW